MIYYSDTFDAWFIPRTELSKLRWTYEQYQKVNPIFINYERYHDRRTGDEPSPEEYQDLRNSKWYIIKKVWRPYVPSNLEGPYNIADLYQVAKERNLRGLDLIKR